jgi:hypothetical protein
MKLIPKLLNATPLPGHRLLLVFENQETRVFDVSIYLDKGVFTELRDESYFFRVRSHPHHVSWPHEQDLSRETLYLRSIPSESIPPSRAVDASR